MQAFGGSHTFLVGPARRLAEQDYERLDHLLGRHVAALSTEIIKLAAFCWMMVLVLAVIVVSALR